MGNTIDIDEMALGLADTEKSPHFDVDSFRVLTKIFMTHNKVENRICIKLNAIDQSAFGAAGRGKVYPVPNKWGKHGWTLVELEGIHPDLLMDAINTAYEHVKGTVKVSKSKTGKKKI